MKTNIHFLFIALLLLASCSDYLDLKPNQKMAIPKTLRHAELLLNDYTTMNTGYPSLGCIAADDHMLNSDIWESISDPDEQLTYTWSVELMSKYMQWQNPYKTVFISNQVLEILMDIDTYDDALLYNRVAGGAYFYRAFAYHQLANVYTVPYQESVANTEMGLPLRLRPELDFVSTRSTLKETYNQIIADYQKAANFLPTVEPLKGRPSKGTAYAGLARLYLEMQDYDKAFLYADSCLAIGKELLDYSKLNVWDYAPIDRFNIEVLFPAVTIYTPSLSQYSSTIPKDLYDSYSTSDLRRSIFFQPSDEDPSSFVFKGSYDNSDALVFVGLTTSEVLLIRAEAATRINQVGIAQNDINYLRRHRWDKNVTYIDIIEQNPDRLLECVLSERRREMVFRGQRWADLRRLNLDSRFAKVLTRQISDKTYVLEPNSLKYAHLIPYVVIKETGMIQNKR